jgi:hypothetical protein
VTRQRRPVLHLFDGDVVNRLTAGAALKERARNVDHVGRAGALVDQGRATALTEAAHRAGLRLLETADLAFPRRDAKALAPGADVGRVHRAMRKPAGAAVIVPSPERGVLHLELHGPAQALAGDSRAARKPPGFHRLRASLGDVLRAWAEIAAARVPWQALVRSARNKVPGGSGRPPNKQTSAAAEEFLGAP